MSKLCRTDDVQQRLSTRGEYSPSWSERKSAAYPKIIEQLVRLDYTEL